MSAPHLRFGDHTGAKRPSKITVPERANPLAKLVFAEMRNQCVTYDELEWRSGVLKSTFKAWRTDNAPGLYSIEAALGAVGWALVPVPRLDRLPPEIADGLAALGAQWARQEPLLHQLLATACLAPILVEGRATPVIDIKPAAVRVKRKARELHPEQTTLFEDKTA